MNANKHYRRVTAGVVCLILTAALLVASCATVVKTEAPQKPAISVLILTGAGMVSSSTDDPRYEQTWLQVAAKYAEGLSEAMKAAGMNPQVYIKKDRSESAGDAASRVIAEDKKDALIQVTVRHVRNSAENTIYLTAELMPLEYQYYSDGKRKAVPRKAMEKSYPILSTTKPDLRNASISELGKGFVRESQQQGYLQK